jgi:hypothetical protein
MRTATDEFMQESLSTKACEAGATSQLKVMVEVGSDDVAFQVRIDGMKLIGEACITCPLGLVSILGHPAAEKDFTCDCVKGRCAVSGQSRTFHVERRGRAMIWSRTRATGSSSALTFDYRQVCQAVHSAMVMLKAVVDANPAGVRNCEHMMPGCFTYDELLTCVAQSRLSLCQASSAP